MIDKTSANLWAIYSQSSCSRSRISGRPGFATANPISAANIKRRPCQKISQLARRWCRSLVKPVCCYASRNKGGRFSNIKSPRCAIQITISIKCYLTRPSDQRTRIWIWNRNVKIKSNIIRPTHPAERWFKERGGGPCTSHPPSG